MSKKEIISWSFPEYAVPQRKKTWYIWAVIAFIALLLYAILTANFLFGLIIIMVTIILFIYHHKEPLEIQFIINRDGIEVGNKTYNFKELKKFWLIYEPPEVKNLYIDFKSTIKPTLVIPLLGQNPLQVRKILKEHLDEDLEKESESTSEALARVLKI